MLSLRTLISELINSGSATGDEIYQCLYDITGSMELGEEVENKAESLMDALSGWCSPDYFLGDGNYGRHQAA